MTGLHCQKGGALLRFKILLGFVAVGLIAGHFLENILLIGISLPAFPAIGLGGRD